MRIGEGAALGESNEQRSWFVQLVDYALAFVNVRLGYLADEPGRTRSKDRTRTWRRSVAPAVYLLSSMAMWRETSGLFRDIPGLAECTRARSVVRRDSGRGALCIGQSQACVFRKSN